MKTEEYIYETAIRIKKQDPSTKVIFYWATDQAGLNCYAANHTMAAHPEWILRDDNGNIVDPGNSGTSYIHFDLTIDEAAKWWISIPLGNGTYKGIPTSTLNDGVLADNAGHPAINNISTARREAL
jgi:hypothetical protein